MGAPGDNRAARGRPRGTTGIGAPSMIIPRLVLLACAFAATPAYLSALDEAEARPLLSRPGFGPPPDEVAALLPLPREAAVAALLAGIRYEPCTPIPAWCETSLADN